MVKLFVGVQVVLLLAGAYAYTTRPPKHSDIEKRSDSDRRSFLEALVIPPITTAALVATTAVEPSFAFENRLDDQYLDRVAQTGRQPDYLGVNTRTSKTLGKDYTGLAPCDGRPNCWCSSTPFQDNPARYIDPWGSSENSIRDVKQVIDTYQVGQQGVDGGGFKIMDYDEGAQYLYVQFQSYKNGYIDDAEFWYNPEKKKFDVRSASRLGQSDLGVNAKRLEYIGSRLEKEFGWPLKRRKNGSLV